MERTILIAGNWKMNGLITDARDRILKLKQLLQARNNVEVLVCPPFTLLAEVIGLCQGTNIQVGGQDCHFNDKGAHTGDISASMLKDLGCGYVILGHSERRTDHHESSELIQKKVISAIQNNLKVILCIGETEEEKKQGLTLKVLQKQLKASIPANLTDNLVIAYEPIWAIGTSITPTVDEIQNTHQEIRKYLQVLTGNADKIQILYGGSLKPSNVKEILQLQDVDGGLIGGAALIIEDFLNIIHVA